LIEIASSGTLFLDEITEMSLTMQAKLLRVIQEKEFFRLGGTIPVNVDVRFIAATNKDIRDEVKKRKIQGRPLLQIECCQSGNSTIKGKAG